MKEGQEKWPLWQPKVLPTHLPANYTPLPSHPQFYPSTHSILHPLAQAGRPAACLGLSASITLSIFKSSTLKHAAHSCEHFPP